MFKRQIKFSCFELNLYSFVPITEEVLSAPSQLRKLFNRIQNNNKTEKNALKGKIRGFRRHREQFG